MPATSSLGRPIATAQPKTDAFPRGPSENTTSTAPPAEPPMKQQPVLPERWSELISRWKQAKPVQGRQFEEAIILEFSPALISLAVNPKSLAGKTLLQKEQFNGFLLQLRELFGFVGVLKIEPREASDSSQESPLESRQRAERDRKDQLILRAQNSTLARDVIAVFNGKIENIEIIDPST